MSVKLLAELIAAGVRPELVAEVAQLAAKVDLLEARRHKEAARKRAQRSAQQIPLELDTPDSKAVSADIQDIQDIQDAPPPPSSSPPTPPLITTPSPVDDGGGGAISRRAVKIADLVMKIAGIDAEFIPPGWCGAPLRVETWLAEGWTEPIIQAGVEAAMARKRDGPPETINYFEKPIRRVFAAQSAPIPNVVPFQQETQNGRGIHPITAARDRAFAHLDAIIERGRGQS